MCVVEEPSCKSEISRFDFSVGKAAFGKTLEGGFHACLAKLFPGRPVATVARCTAARATELHGSLVCKQIAEDDSSTQLRSTPMTSKRTSSSLQRFAVGVAHSRPDGGT